MKIRTGAKYRRARKAKRHAFFGDEPSGRVRARREHMFSECFVLVLAKYVVWRSDYEAVVSRFDAVYDCLIGDAEYAPTELLCGNPICESNGVPVGEIDMLLCLKHLASLPEARIVELKGGTFMLAR